MTDGSDAACDDRWLEVATTASAATVAKADRGGALHVELAYGTRIGDRYEIRDHLGTGGMGTVYAARDRLLDMPVALKFVRPELARDEHQQQRLWREIRLAQTITHVHVVRTFTLEQAAGHLFIVMEMLDGRTVADRLRDGALPVPEALAITHSVLSGLAAVHAKNIVHRDVKPANTRVCGDGRVVLMDFGIARALRPDTESPTSGGEARPQGARTLLA